MSAVKAAVFSDYYISYNLSFDLTFIKVFSIICLINQLLIKMSSVTKRGKYWHAWFRTPKGERAGRSTKQTDKRKALEVAAKWDAAAKKELSATQIQRVMADMYREATGTETPAYSVRDYLNKWCAEKSARGAVRAADKYRQIVKEFICHLDHQADQPLRQLTEAELSSFVLACGKKARARTANKKLTLLASALRDAWSDNLLPDDICKRLKKIKLHEQEPMQRLPFTQEQVDNIICKADGEWKGIATLGAYTGQRLGDIVNFRWGNVGENMLIFTSRKTKRKMRVPLHPLAAAWFLANRGNNKCEAPIFPISLAKFEKHRGNVARLSDEFYLILADLKYADKRTHHTHGNGRSAIRAFSPLSFHSFRHFLTSQLHRCAVAPAVVKNIIGHDSEAVHRIYTNIDDETMMLGIQKFVIVPPQNFGPAPQDRAVEIFPTTNALKEVVNG